MPKKKKPKSPCSGGRPKERKSLDGVKSRNFWNTCPLKLDALPEEECELGQQSARARSDAKVPCEWSINSKEHNYCFWKWLRANSHKDGTMRPMMQSEIADQMGCSSTKVHFILKDGIKKLKKGSYSHHLAELSHTASGEDSDSTVVTSLIKAIDDD